MVLSVNYSSSSILSRHRLAINAFELHKNKSNINKSEFGVSDVPMDAIESLALNELTQSMLTAQFATQIFRGYRRLNQTTK